MDYLLNLLKSLTITDPTKAVAVIMGIGIGLCVLYMLDAARKYR